MRKRLAVPWLCATVEDFMDVVGHTVVYGGSFNPPHMAHQMACLYLLEGLGAEAVWVLPSPSHPFGKELVPFEDRVAMVEAMVLPLGPRVAVSLVESEPDMSGRTYDTLQVLKDREPQRRWALAIGGDILGETDRWHRWSDIVAEVPVIVLGRGGYAAQGEYLRTPVSLPEVSSTQIRRRLFEGKSVEGWVPRSVLTLIQQRKLYDGP